MASQPLTGTSEVSRLLRGFATQSKVVGALLMRELHTRYGRDNIGYLWVIGEPLTLASAIALIHYGGESSHYGGEIRPVPFSVIGYCVFIMFRGIFGRAEGAIEANASLLYHKMVTILDIMVARALLEAAGTFLSLVILMTLLVSIGMAELPERPLVVLEALFYMFWFSFAMGLIVVSVTHDNKLLGRMVHPVAYVMMPLSGAFYQVQWLPEPYRSYMLWFPLPHVFEMVRHGFFRSAPDMYYSAGYLTGVCLIFTYLGLFQIRRLRDRIHLH